MLYVNIRNSASDSIIDGLPSKEYLDKKYSTEFVNQEIALDRKSKRRVKMSEGVAYYYEIQEILKAKADVLDVGGKPTKIDGKSNFKAVHNFHTLMLDEKKDYLLGAGIEFSYGDLNDKSIDFIKESLGKFLDVNLQALLLGAGNKSEEWGHYFINEGGEFDWVVIAAEQIIVFYDGRYDRNREAIIRYYNQEIIDPETTVRRFVDIAEVWTARDVTYYIADPAGGKFVLDKNYILNPRPHVIKGDFLTDNERETLTDEEKFIWGVPPFVPVYNNAARKTDLRPIKSLIDLYDVLIATGSNTIVDLQEAIWEVKGFSGTAIEQLALQLKQYKVVDLTTEDKSGIKGHQLDIPWNARKDLLEKTKDAIYEQGRGVNFSKAKEGNTPSGLALKIMFYPLNMKSNALETYLRFFMDELLESISKWGKEKENLDIDVKQITYRFPRSMITSDVEIAKIAKDSVGVISDETIAENHPFVTDVEVEVERLKKQKAEQLKNINFE